MIPNCTVYRKNSKIAWVRDGEVAFFNKKLERQMRILGVAIPVILQENYSCQFVRYGEPLFAKAFVHIHYPDYLKRQGYCIQDDSTLGV